MEPKNPATEPIDDNVTKLMKIALEEAEIGTANYSSPNEVEKFRGSGWKGTHQCQCGERSSNHDYQLKNGMITNSLCVHYVSCHRDEICDNDILKLQELFEWYEKVK